MAAGALPRARPRARPALGRPGRRQLEELEQALAGDDELLPVAVVTLASVAGSAIEVDDEELRSAGRRALLVLAAGGDPHRGLDLRGPAVSELAAEVDDPERRTTLTDGLARLRSDVAGLRHLSEALQALLDDAETAWRAYACSILAEQLAAD